MTTLSINKSSAASGYSSSAASVLTAQATVSPKVGTSALQKSTPAAVALPLPALTEEELKSAAKAPWYERTFGLSWLQLGRSKKRLQTLETVSLGDKRFIALVRVDHRQFLIGGAPSSVGLLTELAQEESFHQVLNDATQGMDVSLSLAAVEPLKTHLSPHTSVANGFSVSASIPSGEAVTRTGHETVHAAAANVAFRSDTSLNPPQIAQVEGPAAALLGASQEIAAGESAALHLQEKPGEPQVPAAPKRNGGTRSRALKQAEPQTPAVPSKTSGARSIRTKQAEPQATDTPGKAGKARSRGVKPAESQALATPKITSAPNPAVQSLSTPVPKQPEKQIVPPSLQSGALQAAASTSFLTGATS